LAATNPDRVVIRNEDERVFRGVGLGSIKRFAEEEAQRAPVAITKIGGRKEERRRIERRRRFFFRSRKR
jgi:hypothetical protein